MSLSYRAMFSSEDDTQTHTTSTASDSCVSEISSVLTLPAVKSAGYDFDLNNLIKRSADSKNTPRLSDVTQIDSP